MKTKKGHSGFLEAKKELGQKALQERAPNKGASKEKRKQQTTPPEYRGTNGYSHTGVLLAAVARKKRRRDSLTPGLSRSRQGRRRGLPPLYYVAGGNPPVL